MQWRSVLASDKIINAGTKYEMILRIGPHHIHCWINSLMENYSDYIHSCFCRVSHFLLFGSIAGFLLGFFPREENELLPVGFLIKGPSHYALLSPQLAQHPCWCQNGTTCSCNSCWLSLLVTTHHETNLAHLAISTVSKTLNGCSCFSKTGIDRKVEIKKEIKWKQFQTRQDKGTRALRRSKG